MDVVFQADVENRFTLPVEDYGTLYFHRGTYITQDKELIKKLINHSLNGKEYRLKSNEETVVNYLEGKESDKLTEKILDGITRQGILEIGKEVGAKQTQPALIKYEVVGEPITSKVKEIIDFYQIEKTKDEVKAEIEREEKEEVETVSNTLSTDMSAKEAIEYIESHSKDELEGFLAEDEERKTVKGAWDNKE